jgi:hypothetical protein
VRYALLACEPLEPELEESVEGFDEPDFDGPDEEPEPESDDFDDDPESDDEPEDEPESDDPDDPDEEPACSFSFDEPFFDERLSVL